MPFGLNATEILAALFTLALFGLALFYYMTTLGPHQSRLQREESRFNLLDTERIKLRAQASEPLPVDTTQEALESLEAFKIRHLRPISQGEIALYRDINALAARHKVQLASGIDMKREVASGDEEENVSKSKTDPFAAVYPHSVVNFTVAGQYGALRAFLSEMERNQQFIIINNVSLSQVEELQSEGTPRGGAAQQSAIALSVEMTAYFRP
jgi:hypothetical protein